MSEYDEYQGDEENTSIGPVSPPNGADVILALLSPLEGLIAGMQGMMVRVHGLLALQSQYIDVRKERQAAAKELERTLGLSE